jgi:hypothetical protein
VSALLQSASALPGGARQDMTTELTSVWTQMFNAPLELPSQDHAVMGGDPGLWSRLAAVRRIAAADRSWSFGFNICVAGK